MINENFVILGTAIYWLASFRYIIKTLQGKIQPNRVSFFVWALAPLIAFAAQIKQGVGIQSLITFNIGFSPLLILIASFLNKKAYWKLGTFDYICGLLSLIGLSLWYITQNGNVAISFSIIADALAALPTVRKAYRHPETEDSWVFLAAAISAILALLTLSNWSFAYYSFALYTVIICLIIFVLVRFKLGTIKSA